MKCVECGSTEVLKFEGICMGYCPVCKRQVALEDEIQSDKMRVFFSYGHDKHADVVKRLKEAIELRSGGRITVWIDHKEIPQDSHWRERITNGILECQSVLAFLSSYSTRERGVCLDELAIAMVSKHGMIRTILLEPEKTANPPSLVSEYQWGNMSDYPGYAAKGEDAYQEYINRQADRIIAMLSSDEIRQYNHEMHFLREKLGLPEIAPMSKFDLLIRKPMIGRKWLNKEIEKWVGDPSAPRVMMLYGNPGVGKSMYAAHLQHYNPHAAAAIACDYHSDEYSTSDNVTLWLAYKLALRLPDYRQWLIRLFSDSRFDIGRGKDRVDRLLSQFFSANVIDGSRDRYFIIIDAIDEARAADFSEYILDFIEATAHHAPWLRFVITAREEPHITERFGRFPSIRFDENRDRNSQDIREYFDYMLKPLLRGGESEISGRSFAMPSSVRPLTEKEFEVFAGRLTEASRGVFVYAEKVCENIADDFVNGRITALTDYPLPDGIRDLFRDTLDRKFNKESEHYPFAPYSMADFEERFSGPLGMVLASPKPLPAATLIRLMGWNRKQYGSFMFCFGTVLDEKDGCLTPFHKSFAEWLDTTPTRYMTPLGDGIVQLAEAAYSIGTEELDEFLTVTLTRILRRAAELSKDWKHYEEAVNDGKLIDRMFAVGDEYEAHNRFMDAGEVYSELMEVFKVDISPDMEIKDHGDTKIYDYGKALSRYGGIMQTQNRFVDALYYYQKFFAIAMKLTEVYPENPEYQRGLSGLLVDIADIKKVQNDLTGAMELYGESLQIAREFAEAYPENPVYQRSLSVSLERIAGIKKAQNDQTGAMELYGKMLQIERELAEAYTENPEYQRGLSISLERIAGIKEAQNDQTGAMELYGKSLQIARELAEAYPENPAYQKGLSIILERIAGIKKAQKDLAGAMELYEESLKAWRELAETYPENPEYQWALSISLGIIAGIKKAQNDQTGAMEFYEESVKAGRELAETYPENPEYQEDLSISLEGIAGIKKAQNDLTGAMEFYGERLQIARELAETYPENPAYQRDLLISLGRIADIKKTQNDLTGAIELYEEDLQIARELAETYPENPACQRDLSISLERIADIKKEQSDLTGAMELYGEGLQIARDLAEAYPENPEYQRDLSISLRRIADIKKAQNDLAGAMELCGENLQIARDLAEMYPENPEYQRGLYVSYYILSCVCLRKEDFTTSRRYLEAGRSILEELCARFPQSIQYLSDLSDFERQRRVLKRHLMTPKLIRLISSAKKKYRKKLN